MDGPYEWSFPYDHGVHNDYQVEWWYFTGHLNTLDSEVFGFELTFFRVSSPDFANLKSDWGSSDLYFAHFTVTNELEEKFEYFERINRGSFIDALIKLFSFQKSS